jgi:apolipoprotein N-acyltransferase
LLTGAPWYEVFEERGSRLIYYYNSALLLQPGERAEAKYFKSHLVPFGEYVPLRRYLPFIEPLVEAAGHFTPGRIEEPLVTGSIRAGVLICFESIFGDLGRRWVASGANVLVNVTNDAWYGRSSAPYQSWAMTVFRSVETRRSLVRSANTGISGIVDPLGRVVRQSDLFVPWSVAAPVALLEERSPFVRGGYLFAPFCALAAVLILLPGVKRTQRSD